MIKRYTNPQIVFPYACVLEPACAVTTTEPIMVGDTVELTCTITYYATGATNMGTPTISWAAAAGTEDSNTVTPLTPAEAGTLEVVVETTASGSEIPSYDCTATFTFTDDDTTDNDIYATNQVSYTCTSESVRVYSTYLKVLFLAICLAQIRLQTLHVSRSFSLDVTVGKERVVARGFLSPGGIDHFGIPLSSFFPLSFSPFRNRGFTVSPFKPI